MDIINVFAVKARFGCCFACWLGLVWMQGVIETSLPGVFGCFYSFIELSIGLTSLYFLNF